MNTCPACHQHLEPASQQPNQARLEHCANCGVVWLDFGSRRPALYEKLEEQVQRWEANLARRQA